MAYSENGAQRARPRTSERQTRSMLKIVTSPDPILSQVCEPCEVGDKSLKRLAKQMAHAMYKNNGCGIAAPQVGVAQRLVVIDVDWDGEGEQEPIVLVNPEIVELRGEPETGDSIIASAPALHETAIAMLNK